MNGEFTTPPVLAPKLKVDPHRVIRWIREGKLRAIDVGDGSRPRFRIAPEAIEEFHQARAVVPPAPAVRRRKPPVKIVKDYFSDH